MPEGDDQPPAWKEVEAHEEFIKRTPDQKAKVLQKWIDATHEYGVTKGSWNEDSEKSINEFAVKKAQSFYSPAPQATQALADTGPKEQGKMVPIQNAWTPPTGDKLTPSAPAIPLTADQVANANRPISELPKVGEETVPPPQMTAQTEEKRPLDDKDMAGQASAAFHGLSRGSASLAGGMALAGALEVPNATISAFTGPAAPITFAALNMGEFLGGSIVTGIAYQGAEDYAARNSEAVANMQKQVKAHPTAEKIGEAIPMAAQGIQSGAPLIKQLAAGQAKQVAAKVTGSAAAGAVMPYMQTAIEKTIAAATGGDPSSIPMPALEDIAESAAWGALLANVRNEGKGKIGRGIDSKIIEKMPDKILFKVAADRRMMETIKEAAPAIQEEFDRRMQRLTPEMAKTLVESQPTEVLKDLAKDEAFRKSWSQNPAIIDNELARRDLLDAAATAKAEGATATAKELETKTVEIQSAPPPNEQAKPQQVTPVEPAKPPASQQPGLPPDQAGPPPGASPQPGAKPGGEVPPVKERITSAQFTKDGVTTEGANHTEAAQKQGVTAPQDPAGRETPDYTFKTDTGRTVTREEAAQIAKDAGQTVKEPVNGKLHSGDIEAPKTDPAKRAPILSPESLEDIPKETAETVSKASKTKTGVAKTVADQSRQNLGPGAANRDEFETLAKENADDYATIGASHLLEGKTDKASWAAAMEEENGLSFASPQELNKIWKDSHSKVEELYSPKGKSLLTKRQIEETSGLKDSQPKGSYKEVAKSLKAKLAGMITKAQGLAEYLRGMEKGSAVGRKDLKDNADIAIRWHEADKTKIANDVDTFLFKTVKEAGLRIRENDLKNFSVQLHRILSTPFNWKGGRTIDGKFVSTSEMMLGKTSELLHRIEAAANDAYSTDLRNEIRAIHDKTLKSDAVSVDAKKALRELTDHVSMRRMTPASVERTMELQAKLAEAGKNLPPKLRQKLLDMAKTDLKSLSVEELEALRDDIKSLNEMGREQWKNTKEERDRVEAVKLAELVNDESVKPNEGLEKMARDTEVGTWQKIKDSLWNKTSTGLNWASVHEKARLFVPRLFQALDGKENGWLYKNFYSPVLTKMRDFRTEINPLNDAHHELIKRNNITHDDSVRVGIFAHLKQGLEESEIWQFSHAKEKPRLMALVADVKEKGLNKGQQELYEFGRKYFDSTKDDIQRFASENYNKEIKFYDNYSPRFTDVRKSKRWRMEKDQFKHPQTGDVVDVNEVAEGLIHSVDSSRRTRAVGKGILKSRVAGAEMPLNLDFSSNLERHIEDWNYIKHMQPTLNEMGRMANSNAFGSKYGQVGKGLALDYVDALARRGKYSKNMVENGMDFVRSKAMTGMLGFRLTQFKHLANYPIGMDQAGGAHWWTRANMIAMTPEGKEFIHRVWPELRARTSGDITIEEAISGKGNIIKKAFIIDRILDYRNSLGATFGKYLSQLHEAGHDWKEFLNLPVDEEFVNKSHAAMVNSVGSPFLEDRPLIISKGTSMGSASFGRALMAYQGPKMVKWGTLRNTISQDLMRDRRVGKTSKDLALLTASSAIEAAVKYGSKAAWTAAAGGVLSAFGFKIYHRKKEESVARGIAKEAASDFLSNAPFTTPITMQMMASEYPGAERKIFSQTGVPPIDMTVGTFADAMQFIHDPKGKNGVKFGLDVLQSAGVPVSSVKSIVTEGSALTNSKEQKRRDSAEARKENPKKKGEASVNKATKL